MYSISKSGILKKDEISLLWCVWTSITLALRKCDPWYATFAVFLKLVVLKVGVAALGFFFNSNWQFYKWREKDNLMQNEGSS